VRPYVSSSGRKNAGLELLLRKQGGWDTHSSAVHLQTQQNVHRKAKEVITMLKKKKKMRGLTLFIFI
jgi:hypothetical protein